MSSRYSDEAHVEEQGASTCGPSSVLACEALESRVTYAFYVAGDVDTTWLVARVDIDERVSRPYTAVVELAGEHGDVDQLLGRSSALVIRRDDARRTLHGIVARIERAERGTARSFTRVTLVPALAALEARTDCRIFQEMSVPDVLAAVLGPPLGVFGRTLVTRLRREAYPVHEYLVQYRESDLAFAERLMAYEGIWYCFEHPEGTGEGDAERLVLLDDNEGAPVPRLGEDEDVLPLTRAHDGVAYSQGVTRFVREARLSPTSVAVRAFNWTHPALAVAHEAPGSGPGERPAYEPEELALGGYREERYTSSDAEAQARLHWEATQIRAKRARGAGNVVGLCPGQRVKVRGVLQVEEPSAWIVTSVRARGRDAKSTLEVDGPEDYENVFTCAPAELPLRPRRRPKPRVHGVQTGLVVGPNGRAEVATGDDDIHTDEHGRVRVKLAWDRTAAGTPGATTSCFLRVAQPSAGAGFGVVFTPRIGMEVVVSFIDGDPDRPLVTGCVYNGLARAHHELPSQKTRSYIRTRSTPSGRGANELCFEDADGREEVALRAERDHVEAIGRNQRVDIGDEQRIEIGGDRIHRVAGNAVLNVLGEQTVTVRGDDRLAIGDDRTVQVRESERKTIGRERRLEVRGASHESHAGGREIRVQAHDRLVVEGGAHKRDHVSGDYTIRADGHFKVEQGAGQLYMNDELAISVASDLQLENPGFHLHARADGITSIQVARQLEITVGAARIIVRSDGTIDLDGPAGVTLTGAASRLEVGPQAAKLKGPTIEVKGVALTEIKGGIVRLN